MHRARVITAGRRTRRCTSAGGFRRSADDRFGLGFSSRQGRSPGAERAEKRGSAWSVFILSQFLVILPITLFFQPIFFVSVIRESAAKTVHAPGGGWGGGSGWFRLVGLRLVVLGLVGLGLVGLGLSAEGSEGDLGGVKKLGGVVVANDVAEHAVCDAGDEVADVGVGGEAGHGIAIGFRTFFAGFIIADAFFPFGGVGAVQTSE